jgi:hypothetical protein
LVLYSPFLTIAVISLLVFYIARLLLRHARPNTYGRSQAWSG